MNAIFVTLNKMASMIPPIVYLTLIGVLSIGFFYQSWRLDDAHAELGAARAAVDTAKDINKHNAAQIEDFQASTAACLKERRADEQKYIASRAAWNVERTKLNESAVEVRTHEIEIYREPTCAELAQLDVSLSCPALASGLRKRADRLNKIRDRYERGPGSSANTGQPFSPSG